MLGSDVGSGVAVSRFLLERTGDVWQILSENKWVILKLITCA